MDNSYTQHEYIYNALNAKRQLTPTDFFSNTSSVEFWRLSDLAMIFEQIFNVREPITQTFINKMNATICKSLNEQSSKTPKHIVTLTCSYNFKNPETKMCEFIPNGKNQHLSRVACEFIFQEHIGMEFEQAYFLYPNKSITELEQLSKELQLEKIRSKVSENIKCLSSIINSCKKTEYKVPFDQIWGVFWNNLFQTCKYRSELGMLSKNKSPLDYMTYDMLVRINNQFEQVIYELNTRYKNISIQLIQDLFRETALIINKDCHNNGISPKEYLLSKSTSNSIAQIRKQRILFWKKYYQYSL